MDVKHAAAILEKRLESFQGEIRSDAKLADLLSAMAKMLLAIVDRLEEGGDDGAGQGGAVHPPDGEGEGA